MRPRSGNEELNGATLEPAEMPISDNPKKQKGISRAQPREENTEAPMGDKREPQKMQEPVEAEGGYKERLNLLHGDCL